MQRLIADANEYGKTIGLAGDLSMDSFADIVQAIELVQEKQHVAGTTAKEAANTIQGSLGMARSAWTNLVAGLANPEADINKLVKNFTGSASTALKNLLPTIKTGLQGVGAMVTEVLPDIFAMIPDLLDDILPSLMETIDTVITKTFPALIQVVSKNMPMLIRSIAKSGKTIVKSVFNAIDNELSGSKIYTSLKNGLKSVNRAFDGVGSSLFENGKRIIENISNMVSRIDFDKVFNSLQRAATALAPLIESAGDRLEWLFVNVITPFTEWAINDVLPPAIDILSEAFRGLQNVAEFLTPIGKAVWEEFLKPLGEWTSDAVVVALEAVGTAMKDVNDYFAGIDWEGYWTDFDNFAENWSIGADEIGNKMIENEKAIDEFFDVSEFGKGWREFWEKAGEAIFVIEDKSKQAFHALEKNGERAFDGIDEDFTRLKEEWGLWTESFNEVMDTYREGFEQVGRTLEPIGQWFVDQEANLENFGGWIFDAKEKVVQFGNDWRTTFESAGGKVNDVVTSFKENWSIGALEIWDKIDSISAKWDKLKNTISTGAANIGTKLKEVKAFFDGIGTTIKGLIDSAWQWGYDLVSNFIDGVKSLGSDWTSTFEGLGAEIYDYLHHTHPDKGPLADDYKWMPDMMDSFTKGIKDNAHKPIDALNGVVNDMRDSFSQPLTGSVNGYTPYSNVSGVGASEGAGDITLQLVDSAYNVIAKGVAKPLDIINGKNIVLASRGRQL